MKKKSCTRHPGELESIDVVLQRVFSNGKFGSSSQVAQLQTCWHDIVGPDAALHCAPVKITGKKLYVKVDNPVWHQQIDLLKEDMLRKMNSQFQHIGISKIICKSTPF
jgi:hypothetical protein